MPGDACCLSPPIRRRRCAACCAPWTSVEVLDIEVAQSRLEDVFVHLTRRRETGQAGGEAGL